MMKLFIFLSICIINGLCSFYPQYQKKEHRFSNLRNTTNATLPQVHECHFPYQIKGQEVYNGWVNVSKDGSALYYEVYSAQNSLGLNDSKPLIIWLQGGPGCSSKLSLYTEIGPYEIYGEDGRALIKKMNTSWNEDYHVMFIDNPVGVGWSPKGNETDVKSTAEAADMFYDFLSQWYKMDEFKQFNNYDLYLAGESFAGNYIPVFAERILKWNNVNPLPLKGVMIGDGWTDPNNQYEYNQYAYATGLVDKNGQTQLQKRESEIYTYLQQNNTWQACYIWDKLAPEISSQAGNCSVYNIREYNQNSFDGLFSLYLNLDGIQDAFAVPNDWKFYSCNDKIYQDFFDDIMTPKVDSLVYVLENTRVLLYNGQDDLIVNTQGALRWINKMKWEGLQNWQQSGKQIWKKKGTDEIAGTTKNYGNLWWAVVYKAGHMVPTDVPFSAKDMIDRFIAQERDWTK